MGIQQSRGHLFFEKSFFYIWIVWIVGSRVTFLASLEICEQICTQTCGNYSTLSLILKIWKLSKLACTQTSFERWSLKILEAHFPDPGLESINIHTQCWWYKLTFDLVVIWTAFGIIAEVSTFSTRVISRIGITTDNSCLTWKNDNKML